MPRAGVGVVAAMKMSRTWAMPSADTFSVPPIGEFVRRYTIGRKIVVDPFARNCMIGTHRNDLNPATLATHHLPAVDYLRMLAEQRIVADVVLFDPPYSPRQITECYSSSGLTAGMKDTQSGFYSDVRDLIARIVTGGSLVLSFGWSSNGIGLRHGFEIEEIMLVAHGGAHNDTICMAEIKTATMFDDLHPPGWQA